MVGGSSWRAVKYFVDGDLYILRLEAAWVGVYRDRGRRHGWSVWAYEEAGDGPYAVRELMARSGMRSRQFLEELRNI